MFIVSIFIKSLLILAFLMAGGSKIVGAKVQVEAFKHLGLPQWFRVITGLCQYVGVAGLIIGFWYPGMTAWAGIWLGVMMLLACLAHLKVHDPIGKVIPALVLAVISFVLLFINVDGLLHPF